jgi:ubiquinone biosynthesis protein COQ9
VVTESCHHTDVFLSEKIFKPIIGMRPFLVLGDRNIYVKLKELGFDTFEDLFPNVGLDNENYERRAENLLKDLRKICLTPLKDLDDVYNSIYTRLERNRENMILLIEKNKRWIRDLGKL